MPWVRWKKEEQNKHKPHNKQPNKKQTKKKQKLFLLHNTRPFDDNAILHIVVGLESFNYGAS